MLAEHYLSQVRRTPLLTREAQQALTDRWISERQPRDREALIRSNLRLVLKIANEYTRYRVAFEDLVQAGNVGLCLGVDRYEGGHGAALSTYVSIWIRATICYLVMNGWSIVRLGTTERQRKVFHTLTRGGPQGNQLPDEEIAIRCKCKVEEVVEMRQRIGAGAVVSMTERKTSGSDGDDLTWEGLLAADLPHADDVLDEAQRAAMLRAVVAAMDLDRRERAIVEQRLLTDDPATLTEMGARLSKKVAPITREWVRQIEKKVKRRIAAAVRRCEI